MERGLWQELDFDAERAERIRRTSLSRRRLLWAGGAAIGAAAVTRSLGSWPAFGYDTPIVKPHHTATPEIDPATWRLRIHGTGVRRELSLSYDDLLRLPGHGHASGRARGQRSQLLRHPAGHSRRGHPVDAGRDRRCLLDRRTALRGVRDPARVAVEHHELPDVRPRLPGHAAADHPGREERARASIPGDLRPGQHTIRVRARDDRGNVQPTSVPFNEQGYLFGAVVAHPVSVE